MISLASVIRLSVTPLMADTTTTTWSPAARYWRDARGDVLDAIGISDRGAAVFLDDERHENQSYLHWRRGPTPAAN